MKNMIFSFIIAAASAVISGCATGQVADGEHGVSSFIQETGYDADASTLIVRFENKQAYKFLNVPNEVYETLMTAESKAQYFNTNINGIYSYEAVE